MCQAQQQSASLGYSPMPINLVEASFDQIRKIPGVVVQDIDVTSCNNPTFSPDGTNLLAQNAPHATGVRQAGPEPVRHRDRWSQAGQDPGGLRRRSADAGGRRRGR